MKNKKDINPFKKFEFTRECDAYNERAAIMEFDGGLDRAEAERLAKIAHPKDEK